MFIPPKIQFYCTSNCQLNCEFCVKNDTELSVDMDMETFKKHIEKQFQEGMTWDNHGEVWHIDHIKPIKFRENGEEPSVEEVVRRLHYKNTQPLWALENISKGNRYIG